MVRYPFTPFSRRFFDKLPIEESFSSSEVLRQAESRLLGAIRRVEVRAAHVGADRVLELLRRCTGREPGPCTLVRSSRRRRATLQRDYFVREKPQEKPVILQRVLRGQAHPPVREPTGYVYSMPVEDYLRATTQFELKSQSWKLVNRPLAKGVVYLTENDVNDLFGDLSEKMIYGGVKNLRKVAVPEAAGRRSARASLPFLPPPKVEVDPGVPVRRRAAEPSRVRREAQADLARPGAVPGQREEPGRGARPWTRYGPSSPPRARRAR